MFSIAGKPLDNLPELFTPDGKFQSQTAKNLGFLPERFETQEEVNNRWMTTYMAVSFIVRGVLF